MTKFHKNRTKIVDFLFIVNLDSSRKFSSSISTYVCLDTIVNEDIDIS